MGSKQLVIEGMSRPRARLLEDEEGEDVALRVPTGVAEAVTYSPAEIREHMALEAQRMHAEMCTPWNTQRPPMVGLYEITDHMMGMMRTMWWWDGLVWIKSDDPHDRFTGAMRPEQFAQSYAWRGLKERPADGYPTPPYRVTMLPAGTPVYPMRPRVRLED